MLVLVLLGFSRGYSQTTLYSNNFDSGSSSGWTLQGTWELTTSKSYSTSYSLTTANSSGTYLADQNISATLNSSINLSSYKGAEVEFQCQYDLEQSFDYAYLEVSINGGTTWYEVKSFNGTQSSWTLITCNIGNFAGNSNVMVRFRLKSDQAVQYAGMYIDDFKIIGLDNDDSPPFIVEQSPKFYQGVSGVDTVNTQIFDATGIQSATLYYSVGGTTLSLSPSSVSGNDYVFIIPAQSPGTLVYYKIGATDSSPNNYSTDTSSAQANYYISGMYYGYDNGAADQLTSFTSNQGAAVKITIPSGNKGTLVTALIRNYIDSQHSENNMLFHVWADNGGKPGADLITPFAVSPAATLTNPYPMTVVDLRAYNSQLSNLTGDFYIGFTVPSGTVNIINSNSVIGNRSFKFSGTSWSTITNTDYELRAIVDDPSAMPVELTSFTAESVNSAIVLKWATATEVNNYGFQIERKLNNNSDWQEIGFVQGHGNSNSPKQYSYTNNNLVGSGVFQYRLKQIDNDGAFEYSNVIEVKASLSDFELSQNSPNPFNPVTTIRYQLPRTGFVNLVVYNILGKEVKALVNEVKGGGTYAAEFNGGNLSSGVYIYRLEIIPTDGSKPFVAVKKLMLLK